MSSEASLSATFICVGMMNTVDSSGKMYQAWDQGGVELHSEMVEYGAISEEVYNALNKIDEGECPGVWGYEVDETFGDWIGNQILLGKIPSREVGTMKLIEIACEFWSQKDEAKKLELVSKVYKQLTTFELTEPSDSEKKLEALRDEVSELSGRLSRTLSLVDRDRLDINNRCTTITKRMDGITVRLVQQEERYNGFLVGLNENIAKQVAKKIGEQSASSLLRKTGHEL